MTRDQVARTYGAKPDRLINVLPDIFIVVLNWNDWRDTLACLESLDLLEYGRYRILLIDNGSDDDSVERLQQARPELRLLQTGRNLGFGGGCNLGIGIALDEGADYVWFLNNDTKVCARALSALVERAEYDKTIGAVGSIIWCMDRPGKLQYRGGGMVNLLIGRATRTLCKADEARIDWICAASMLVPMSALLDIGGFDDSTFFLYAEDIDLSLRLKMRGWQLAVAAESTVHHKGNASLGKDNPLLFYYVAKSNLLLFWRYSPVPFLTAFLVTLRFAVRLGLAFKFRKLLEALRGIRDALRQIRLRAVKNLSL